jgi:hypothetical protein
MTAYVLNGPGVTPVDLVHRTAGAVVPNLSPATAMVLNPSGTTLYLGGESLSAGNELIAAPTDPLSPGVAIAKLSGPIEAIAIGR